MADFESIDMDMVNVRESDNVSKDFDNYESEFITTKKSELDLYLEETRFDLIKHYNLDILEYWKSNCDRYLVLVMMAHDIMAISITSVASKSTFSIDSKVLNKYQSLLQPKNAESLMCTQAWLYGYEFTDDDLDVLLTNPGIAESRDSTIKSTME